MCHDWPKFHLASHGNQPQNPSEKTSVNHAHMLWEKPNSTPKWFKIYQPIKDQKLRLTWAFQFFFNGFKTYGASIVQNTAFESPRNHVLEGPEWACHILRMDGCIKRGQKFEIHSVEICASAKQFFPWLFTSGMERYGKVAFPNPSFNQPFWTILPTNSRNHTERLSAGM